MAYDVVVLIEREMSEGDARRVAALHARREETVDYHLLISSHHSNGFGGTLALLGSNRTDMYGLPVEANGSRTAPELADPAEDLASVIEHSARRLRSHNSCHVNVSITHGEVLIGLKALLISTASQEVVVVAWPETAARFLVSEWPQRARKVLKVPQVRVLEHYS
ncbi:MAG: hypothetical protein QOG10_2289 [Kribbellaceae bacterium]|jgi:hypothetical protein|nr:hypothetical protein [Kribbellaceae bacterium]